MSEERTRPRCPLRALAELLEARGAASVEAAAAAEGVPCPVALPTATAISIPPVGVQADLVADLVALHSRLCSCPLAPDLCPSRHRRWVALRTQFGPYTCPRCCSQTLAERLATQMGAANSGPAQITGSGPSRKLHALKRMTLLLPERLMVRSSRSRGPSKRPTATRSTLALARPGADAEFGRRRVLLDGVGPVLDAKGVCQNFGTLPKRTAPNFGTT